MVGIVKDIRRGLINGNRSGPLGLGYVMTGVQRMGG